MAELLQIFKDAGPAAPWLLVVLAFLLTWLRERRMANERKAIGKRLDEIEKEYREDLKMLLRQCFKVIRRQTRATQELTRTLHERPCLSHGVKRNSDAGKS